MECAAAARVAVPRVGRVWGRVKSAGPARQSSRGTCCHVTWASRPARAPAPHTRLSQAHGRAASDVCVVSDVSVSQPLFHISTSVNVFSVYQRARRHTTRVRPIHITTRQFDHRSTTMDPLSGKVYRQSGDNCEITENPTAARRAQSKQNGSFCETFFRALLPLQ